MIVDGSFFDLVVLIFFWWGVLCVLDGFICIDVDGIMIFVSFNVFFVFNCMGFDDELEGELFVEVMMWFVLFFW